MPVKELTLWKSVELFLKDEDIKNSPSRWRREISLSHLVDCFGKDRPVKDIWIPQLKQYRAERMAKGMKPGTVNREMSTLSKLFGVLIELQFAETNPCRLVRRLSERAGQRQAYVSFEDFNRIVDACGGWFKPIVQLAYYGGM
jgi:site-specific recombinase XerD